MAVRGPIWKTLGIDPTQDTADIRRAYARQLKVHHPEDDPEGFGRLRLAYETAVELAHASHLRSLDEENLVAVEPPDAKPRWVEPAPDRPPFVPVRPPFPDDLTIDQMLDELALDERREPELQRLRQKLAARLRSGFTPDERASALNQIFQSEAMQSSRLYAETEAWIAGLLRGSSAETDALLDRCIAFFSWDDPNQRSRYGQHALARRQAVALRNTLQDPSHRLHKAFIVLQRPILDSYKLQYGMTFGLRPRMAELMKIVDTDKDFERLLDPDAVTWWRYKLKGLGYGPARFWGMVVLPVIVATLATTGDERDYGGGSFFAVWLATLCGYLAVIGLALGITAYIRTRADTSRGWIDDLGEAAP